MSFGFSIGDFLAAIHTIKRIAEEVQSYKDAPRHFQQLSAELGLLHNTLQCVLHIQTTDPNELANLDRIRMISMQCHQHIQAFMDKMRPKETSLGHFRSAGTASTIGKKLHWSLIAKKDVEGLRKVIVSEMVSINVLLGVQQLNYLRILSKESSTFEHDTREYFLNSTALLSKSVEILQNVKTLPQEIHTLQGLAVDNASKQDALHAEIIEGVSGTLSQSTQKFGHIAAKAMITMASLAANIKRLLRLLITFSREMRHQIATNTMMLLDMHGNIKRIVRAIEAIPLHLTLDIVRFDDALGESWALPFQACSDWPTFYNTLKAVVFANHRPGSGRVTSRQFIITSAKDNSEIWCNHWRSTIKPGAHISQSMLISSEQVTGDMSQLSSCNDCLASLPDARQGYNCPKCGRWSTIHNRSTNILHRAIPGAAKLSPAKSKHKARLFEIEGSCLLRVQNFDDDISCFRRVHIIRGFDTINSLEEANALLSENTEDARALQYIAWFKYPPRSNIQEEPREIQTLESIINLLTRSAASDPRDNETWYILGRAYMDVQQYHKAWDSYQRAILCAPYLSGYWNSIGLVYFAVNQNRDCLDGLSIAVRLNPYIPEIWYNLGALYEAHKQPLDAIDCYDRCLVLSTIPDPAVSNRVNYLRQIVTEGAVSQAAPLPMKDIDIRGNSKQAKKVDHQEDIQIPELNTNEWLDSGEEWTDTEEEEKDVS